MLIRKITLVNYCQHEHRTIDVVGNLVAVVGHNGVGKSNFLGALQFALTGEQPDKNKSDLLHWGAKEGHVAVEFEQDGKPGRIERSVSSNKVTLEYDGVTTSGITNVAKEMTTHLHMDKDLVKQSVFVRQTEVDAIISAKTEKRDREVAFQRLLGIDAAKVHKNLTDWLYSATKPISYDIQITEASQRLGELESREVSADGEVKSAEHELAEFGEVDESQSANLAKAVAAVARVLQAQDDVRTCSEVLAMRKADLDAAKAAVADCGQNPGHDIAELAGQELVLVDELRKIKAYDAARDALKQAQEALDLAYRQPHPPDEDIATYTIAVESAQSQLAAIRADKALRAKAVAALDGATSTCPVCGKPLDEGMVESMKQELSDLTSKEEQVLALLQTNSDTLAQRRNAITSWRQSVAVAQSRFDAARDAIVKCESSDLTRERVDEVLAKVRLDWQAQRDYDMRIAHHRKAIEDAELRYGVAQKALDTANDRVVAADAEARKLCGDEAAADWANSKVAMDSIVAETDKRRARHTELRLAVERSKATRDEVAKSLETLKKTVASLKDAQKEQDELAKRLHVVERVKDWFHYTNGPRVLVTQVLGALTDDVNRFLGNFTAPFIVVPDPEQVGFRVQFTDGRDCPEDPPGTGVLSGGERVQLAVAFRLAIYGMFAGKLGLLSLDEPTAYLDDSNVDRFGVLLTKVKDIARNMNTQVFMATHERSVIPYMDSVIDLN